MLILLLAFCGLADSSYLAQSELSGAPLLCDIKGLSDCNLVAQSAYSHLFGIPLAQYGILFYSSIFILAALELLIYNRLLRRLIQWGALLGLLGSIWFTLNQVFFIGAFCIYCLISGVITLLIFLFASMIEPLREHRRLLPVDTHPPTPPPPYLPMPPTT